MDDILPTLGTIARIHRGDKLRVKGKNIDIDNRYGQCIFRFWDKEGRDSTISHLKLVYRITKKTSTELLVCIKNHQQTEKKDIEYRDKCRRLKELGNGLGKSFIGIKNLEFTYADCPSILSELDYIISSIIEPLYEEIYNAMLEYPDFLPKKYEFNSDIKIKKKEMDDESLEKE
jgi:hypothetical protein